MNKIAVIGAGITGLSVANELSKLADVTVFDKSRGLGGRMATRRINRPTQNFQFDHGAQYFVAKSHEFQAFLQTALQQQVIARWDANFAEIDACSNTEPVVNMRRWSAEFPHYVGVPTMNALAKFMAEGLDIHLNTQVGSINRISQANKSQTKWQLKAQDDTDLGVFDWVIVTCPVAQTRALLPVTFSHHERLMSIELLPCFTVMLGFDHEVKLPFQAALVRHADISWIAVNSEKPHRPNDFTVVIQSSNSWAADHVDDKPSAVGQHLVQTAIKLTGAKLDSAIEHHVHRWLYANTEPQRQNFGDVFVDTDNQLAAAGDWCGNARVESAFLHGKRLSEQLIPNLGVDS